MERGEEGKIICLVLDWLNLRQGKVTSDCREKLCGTNNNKVHCVVWSGHSLEYFTQLHKLVLLASLQNSSDTVYTR